VGKLLDLKRGKVWGTVLEFIIEFSLMSFVYQIKQNGQVLMKLDSHDEEMP